MTDLDENGKDEYLGCQLDVSAVGAMGQVRVDDGAVLVVGVVAVLLVACGGGQRPGRLASGRPPQECRPAREPGALMGSAALLVAAGLICLVHSPCRKMIDQKSVAILILGVG